MEKNNTQDKRNIKEIDIKDIISVIFLRRYIIGAVAIASAIVGGFIGFLTPEVYTAKSTFLPQTTESGIGGNFGGLAALAGINLNPSSSGGEIPPSAYSRVVASQDFKKRILDSIILVEGDSISYREYKLSQPISMFGNITNFISGILDSILGGFNSRNKVDTLENESVLQAISDKEFKLHKVLSEKIRITIDKKDGIVFLTVEEENPFIAAQVAQVTEKILQDWIIENKVKNAKVQYDFIAKQYNLKRQEFFSLQDKVSSYIDKNQNISLSLYQNNLNRMQAEVSLINSVFTELAKQKEQAAIQLSKDTPTFSILEPVVVPKQKTAPKKSLYILISFFLGLIFSSIWFIFRDLFEFDLDLK